jgi:transposase
MRGRSFVTQDSSDIRAALEALGLDPDIVVLPSRAAPDEDIETPADGHDDGALTDAEWALIAPLLPDEAAQAHAEGNRAFVDAVLWMFANKKHWTQLGAKRGEAVRRRYARWAHAGVWQTVTEHTAGRGLDKQRAALFAAIARRAEQLRSKRAARSR